MESLKKQSEFDLTYSKGKVLQNSFFRMFVYDRENAEEPQIGFVVSKKFGNAVKRNKLKRRMKEAWRMLNNISNGKNYILIPRKKAASSSFDEIKGKLFELIEKIR